MNQDGAGNTVGEEVEQVCYYRHYCNYVDIGDFTDTFKQCVKDKVHQGTKQRSMLARMTIRARSEL